MKIKALKIVIAIILLTSASTYSQDSQPKRINYQGTDGVFISIQLMDSVVFKLIDRKTLLQEKKTLTELYFASKEKEQNYEAVVFLLEKSNSSLKLLNQNTEKQRDLFKKNLEIQEAITKETKKQARKNGLVFFASGLAVGVIGVLLL